MSTEGKWSVEEHATVFELAQDHKVNMAPGATIARNALGKELQGKMEKLGYRRTVQAVIHRLEEHNEKGIRIKDAKKRRIEGITEEMGGYKVFWGVSGGEKEEQFDGDLGEKKPVRTITAEELIDYKDALRNKDNSVYYGPDPKNIESLQKRIEDLTEYNRIITETAEAERARSERYKSIIKRLELEAQL